jgi:hypothetical protein
MVCSQIPYTKEQGIFSSEQGNLIEDQGNQGLEQGSAGTSLRTSITNGASFHPLIDVTAVTLIFGTIVAGGRGTGIQHSPGSPAYSSEL